MEQELEIPLSQLPLSGNVSAQDTVLMLTAGQAPQTQRATVEALAAGIDLRDVRVAGAKVINLAGVAAPFALYRKPDGSSSLLLDPANPLAFYNQLRNFLDSQGAQELDVKVFACLSNARHLFRVAGITAVQGVSDPLSLNADYQEDPENPTVYIHPTRPEARLELRDGRYRLSFQGRILFVSGRLTASFSTQAPGAHTFEAALNADGTPRAAGTLTVTDAGIIPNSATPGYSGKVEIRHTFVQNLFLGDYVEDVPGANNPAGVTVQNLSPSHSLERVVQSISRAVFDVLLQLQQNHGNGKGVLTFETPVDATRKMVGWTNQMSLSQVFADGVLLPSSRCSVAPNNDGNGARQLFLDDVAGSAAIRVFCALSVDGS